MEPKRNLSAALPTLLTAAGLFALALIWFGRQSNTAAPGVNTTKPAAIARSRAQGDTTNTPGVREEIDAEAVCGAGGDVGSPNYVAVWGVVLDERHKPIEGALVRLSARGLGDPNALDSQSLTNSLGKFK